jgi:hypothetical protein
MPLAGQECMVSASWKRGLYLKANFHTLVQSHQDPSRILAPHPRGYSVFLQFLRVRYYVYSEFVLSGGEFGSHIKKK